MRHVLLTFVCLLLTSLPALSACTGTDMRPGLSPAERAEIDARTAATPYAEGNHWTATRGDQTLHLIGTVHMSDTRLDAAMQRLRPVLEQAQVLMVEMTADGKDRLERAMLQEPERVFITQGPTLPELLSEQDWHAVADAAQRKGIPPFMASKFQPWYLSMVLAIPSCIMDLQREGAKGFDQRLIDAAQDLSLPQQALEPYDTVFSLFASEPVDQQLDYLKLGALPEEVANDALATLLDAYFEERTAEIIEFSRILSRRHIELPDAQVDLIMDDMNATLLDQRNRDWMPVILNAPVGVSIVASGAGHLIGENGLLNLLAQEGYTLQRQVF